MAFCCENWENETVKRKMLKRLLDAKWAKFKGGSCAGVSSVNSFSKIMSSAALSPRFLEIIRENDHH